MTQFKFFTVLLANSHTALAVISEKMMCVHPTHQCTCNYNKHDGKKSQTLSTANLKNKRLQNWKIIGTVADYHKYVTYKWQYLYYFT